MVGARFAAQQLYCDECDIYESVNEKRENHSTNKRFQLKYAALPCKISFSYISRSREGDGAEQSVQTVRLFLSPDIPVLPGSRIVVRHRGRELDCRGSGTPAVYTTHQQVKLERVGGWN